MQISEIIRDLGVEEVMTDEGFQRMKALVEHSTNMMRRVVVGFEEGCVKLECEVKKGLCDEDMEQVEDIAHALIDIMSRELVYGWDLIEDALVTVFEEGADENLMSADMIYERERHVVKVGLLRKGQRVVVLDLEV